MPVNTKIKLLEGVKADLDLVDALWGGTRTMREAGTTYLPKEVAEEVQDWKIRRDRSTLTNFFKKSVKTMAGRLFEDKVTIADDAKFDDFEDNVDLEGRNLHRFGYDLTKMTLRDGLRFIVVDAPSADGVETAADEMAAGIRPYFIEVDVRNVLGWKTEDIAGQRVITQFRYIEYVSESMPNDDWVEKQVKQIRVIEPGIVSLYREAKQDEWVLYGQIETSIDFVAVVPVYAGRQGFMDFEPPLLDLAWLNVEHWQKSSDQSNILHVARVPILHWAGYGASYDENGKEINIVIGPNTLAKSKDKAAKLEYVEHSGAAIGAGRQDLMDIEARAAALGADFTTARKSGDISATEAAIDEAGDVSDLSAFAQNVKDSIELAFSYAAKMMGQTFNGYVTMNTDLGIMSTPVSVESLVKIRGLGDISREGMFEVLNEEWGTDLNAETETERLLMEGPSIQGELSADT